MAKNLNQQINDIGNQIESVITGEYSLQSLLTNDFVQKHSKFESLDDLLSNGGFQRQAQEEFDAIDENELDDYIKGNTNFKSWNEMTETAFYDYARKNLGME